LDITACKRKGHRFNRLAVKVKQLAVQVGERPRALFRALEERGKVGMIGNKLIGESFDIA
jgi:hypothetical protein